MDLLTQEYQEVIETLLKNYANFLGQDQEVQTQLIFDQTNHHYLLLETGWQRGDRIYGTLIHLDIINNKIWIQQDGTETPIADELVAMGIEKQNIILGYKSPERRKITEFAVN